MRKIITISIIAALIILFVTIHFVFVGAIKSGGMTYYDYASTPPYKYTITSIYPSGFKTFNYLPGGENTFDIGVGIVRLPLIRYSVIYSAENGKYDPVLGPVIESYRFMSYFPIKMASHY